MQTTYEYCAVYSVMSAWVYQIVQPDIAIWTSIHFILVLVYTVASTSWADMADDDFDEIDKLCNVVSDTNNGISSDESEENDMEFESCLVQRDFGAERHSFYRD